MLINAINNNTIYTLYSRFPNSIFSPSSQVVGIKMIHDIWKRYEDDGKYNDSIRVDIIELSDNVKIIVEIPGYKKEDITIEFEKGYLTIAGNNSIKEDKDIKYLHHEIYNTQFIRKFNMQEDFNIDKIDAIFKNGTLTITLVKSEVSKLKKITIN